MGEGSAAAVGRGFDRAAGDYDDLLRLNRAGAERLVASLPPGDHGRLLDVGCGTGFVTEAMIARFRTGEVTGVDPSEGMLEALREKLAGRPGLRLTLHRAGVLDMPVPDGAFDAVLSGMAFHWFPDKPAAVARMARCLRPGGVLGILAAGRGTDEELRRLLLEMDPPPPALWVEVFEAIHRDGRELAAYMEAAGLEVVDAWEERRARRADPEAFIARIRAVAGHLSEGMDPEEAERQSERVADAVRAASGPRGFAYTFVKLFGIGRRAA